ncbi:MAG: hypothetical protein KatS3mg110_1039 [Pirellulaceae bacterium]|nr:MAG: hypothetical protein KatS3mg110_1039 [Pirellulaceae bacterium]
MVRILQRYSGYLYSNALSGMCAWTIVLARTTVTRLLLMPEDDFSGIRLFIAVSASHRTLWSNVPGYRTGLHGSASPERLPIAGPELSSVLPGKSSGLDRFLLAGYEVRMSASTRFHSGGIPYATTVYARVSLQKEARWR